MLSHGARTALEFQSAAMRILSQIRQIVVDEFDPDLFMQPVDGGAHVVRIKRKLRDVVEIVAVGSEVLDHGFRRVVLDAELLLQLRALSHNLTARNRSRAADEGHLFDEDDVQAVVTGADRRGHARTAAAHDHHVGVEIFILGGLLDLDRNERCGINAGLLYAVCNSVANGFRGNRSAGDAVDIRRLLFGNAAG